MRILASIFFTLISTHLLAAYTGDWEVVKITNKYESLPIYPEPYPVSSTFHFKNNEAFSTNIINTEAIDTVLSKEGIPFVIFSGVDCYDCEANLAIYVHSPKAGFLDGNSGKNRYSYPGKLFYYLDNSLLHEQRLFYGNCLSQEQKNVVWYSNYLGEDGMQKKGVYVVNFVGSKRQESNQNVAYSYINKTLDLVKSGQCIEILGTEMTSEP